MGARPRTHFPQKTACALGAWHFLCVQHRYPMQREIAAWSLLLLKYIWSVLCYGSGCEGCRQWLLGGRRGTRQSFSLLVNFHLLCMQDESRKYFCYQIFRRVCRKVLRGHVYKLFRCSLVQQVCIKCTSSCFP